MLSPAQRRDLLGLALLALAVFTALSLVPTSALGETGGRLFPSGNIMGVVGRAFAGGGFALLGAGLPLVPLLFVLAGAACFGWLGRELAVRLAVLGGGLVFLVPMGAATAAAAGAAATAPGAGWSGHVLAGPLVSALGWFGAAVLLAFTAVALCVATIGWNPGRSLGRGLWRGLSAVGGAVAAGLDRVAGAAAAFRDRAAARSGVPEPAGAAVAAPTEAADVAGAKGAAGARPMPAGSGAGGGPDPTVSAGPGAGGARNMAGHGKKRGLLGRLVSEGLPDPGRPESEERPSLDLLSRPAPRDVLWSERELDRLGDVLVDTLRTFKVEGRITGRTTGPVVTQFEVVPAPGIKVNRIASLDADLALALKAPSVRIVAPIPGKGAVGVEVPNPEPEIVYLREILESPVFQSHRGHLPLALGKDLEGRPYVADLARMPHLLIAGATGSGKSVCINTIITSLVFRHSPRTLRLLLIDPKMVELSIYGALPHLRHPVVTDPRDAAIVLKWAVLEMERRYNLLSENGARSLAEFNRRAEAGEPLRRVDFAGAETARRLAAGVNPREGYGPAGPGSGEPGEGGGAAGFGSAGADPGAGAGAVPGGAGGPMPGGADSTMPVGAGDGPERAGDGPERAAAGGDLDEPSTEPMEPDWLYTEGPLPYIVVVVDELADLMMAVQSEIERPLAQLAQKARAIGIHLIVATQRPSVNVITGLIKANFPSRVAFRVSSKVDSRTILDQNGADALLGNGDMLFLPPGQSDPVRVQGAFMATEDTERLMSWYRERETLHPAGAEDDILDLVRAREDEGAEEMEDEVLEERDPLFRQAAEICIQFQQGSTSLLQRRLRIGYGRAARIIDQLHHAGVLGPADGSKAREVLIGLDALDFIDS